MSPKVQQNIQMVELCGQYQKIKAEVDHEIKKVIDSTRFVGGPQIQGFQKALEDYLNVNHVIPCANGTDALQIALMALEPGDEVIVPAFTYVATAEVIALLHLKPVMVDVDPNTFNTTEAIIESAITPRTKAIVPVHLFGQCADMEPIMEVAKKHSLYVVEDNAQAIGSDYTFKDGTQAKGGTIAHIGTTSFFPSKNLGCYGDGGALFTNDEKIAGKIRMVANHGQSKQYHHAVIGVNSRLDAIQAAVLNVKLRYLDDYCKARQQVAATYDQAFQEQPQLVIPYRRHNSTHVFHQYTLLVKDGRRNALAEHLAKNGIPYGIYYPVPLYKQKAFVQYVNEGFELPNTELLCRSVISLPIHTEMQDEVQEYIISKVLDFFRG